MEKAVVYIRVSTQEQAVSGVSLAAQEERVRAYCLMNGLEIVKVIREEGVSASKPMATRPGGKVLTGLVEKKKVRHVVALKLDRLFRNAEDALHTTSQWEKNSIALHLVDMGGQTINTGTAMGKFFLNMMAGFAELERNLISERTEQALQHKKSNKEVYASIPYGYDRQGDRLIENMEEHKVIDLIKKWRGEGWSLRKIADELNGRGTVTKQGAKWYASTVKYILNNSLHREVAA